MTLIELEKEVATLLIPLLAPLGLSFAARETTICPGDGKGAVILMIHDLTFPGVAAWVTARETDGDFAIVPTSTNAFGMQAHFTESEVILSPDAAYRQTVNHLMAHAPEVRQSIDRLRAPRRPEGKPEPRMSVKDLSETLWKKEP